MESNPARNTKLPRSPERPDDGENKVIPISRREALLKAAAEDPIMSPAITTLMLTGMRIGELLALQWKHVDFKAKTITIQQSLTRELVFDEDGKTEKMVDAWEPQRPERPSVSSRHRTCADTAAGMDAVCGKR